MSSRKARRTEQRARRPRGARATRSERAAARRSAPRRRTNRRPRASCRRQYRGPLEDLRTPRLDVRPEDGVGTLDRAVIQLLDEARALELREGEAAEVDGT